jgi:hypothetical protein
MTAKKAVKRLVMKRAQSSVSRVKKAPITIPNVEGTLARRKPSPQPSPPAKNGQRPLRTVSSKETPLATLRTSGGYAVALTCDSAVASHAALAWSYIVGSRSRWKESSAKHTQTLEERCQKQLEQLGLSSHALQNIARAQAVEVELQWPSAFNTQLDQEHPERAWPAAMLPWEYLLSTATRPHRGSNQFTVLRLLPGANAPSRRAGSILANCSLVLSNPGPVGEFYDFTSERALVERTLRPKQVLSSPTLESLKQHVEKRGPTLIHMAGVDTAQGAELGTEWLKADGMILADASNSATPVPYEELAQALCAHALRKPKMVSFNFYRSGSRTAALCVRHGAEIAIGFQDTFDDLAAEMFFGALYRALRAGRSEAEAFAEAFQALRESKGKMEGSGIVVWSAHSLLQEWAATASTTSLSRRIPEVAAKLPDTVEGLRKILRIGESSIIPLERLNYSLLHNRMPIFDRFQLVNTGETPLSATIRVSLNAGDRPLVFESVESLGEMVLDLPKQVFLPLTSELARNLDESIRTTLKVEVSVGAHAIYGRSFPVTLLPINEWVDDDNNRHWLPSFVFPTDASVRRIIESAAAHLRSIADDPSAGFDGYQSIDPDAEDATAGVDHQVAAIWSALVQDYRLGYINPSPSYTNQSQRVRTPSDVIEGKRGTCIDLALLLCACLEYINIYPVMFLLEGHAFPGYWRSDEDWQHFISMDDALEMPTADLCRARKRAKANSWPHQWVITAHAEVMRPIEQGALVPLEAVWLTNYSSFSESVEAGHENLENPREFNSLLDITRARESDVTPLPLLRSSR